jgi:hypothetical protein
VTIRSILARGANVRKTPARLSTVAILCSLCACAAGSSGHPGLEQIAGAIAESGAPSGAPFSVVAEVVDPHSAAPALRFLLSNITREQQIVKRGTLPWENAAADSVTGVTVQGRVLPIRPPLGLGLLSDRPEEVAIAPGATLVGERPLNDLFAIEDRSSGQDMLLLWTYRQGRYSYNGIALLAKN